MRPSAIVAPTARAVGSWSMPCTWEPHEPSDAMDAIVEELAALADRLGRNRVVLPSKIA